MNFLGKILTMLTLVMSLAFLMLAVAIFQTHRNWRDDAIKNRQKIGDLTTTNKKLQDEIQREKDRLHTEIIMRRYALAALETKATQSETQLQQRNQQLAELQARAGTMSTQIAANAQVVQSTLAQNSKLRTDLQEAELTRDNAFDRYVQVTDLLHQAQGTLASEREVQQQLIASNARMKLVMDRYDLTEFTSVDGKPPRVEGIVTAVGKKDLLEISIGDDDGLKKGHTLEIFRSNSYLGRVIVRETWPDRAVVQVIPEFQKGIIKKGDRVATKFG